MFTLDHLPHRRRDEEIVFMLRRDYFILIKIIAFYVFLFFVPLIAKWYIVTFKLHYLSTEMGYTVLILIMFLYYLYVLLFFYRAFLDYYLDVWIVTNHRILSIELQGLFNRVVSEHKLFRIQDVTTEQVGFLAHFFHFGHIYIQTAATKQRFIFEQISEPEKVARRIVQLIEWHKKAYPDEHD